MYLYRSYTGRDLPTYLVSWKLTSFRSISVNPLNSPVCSLWQLIMRIGLPIAHDRRPCLCPAQPKSLPNNSVGQLVSTRKLLPSQPVRAGDQTRSPNISEGCSEGCFAPSLSSTPRPFVAALTSGRRNCKTYSPAPATLIVAQHWELT